MNNKTVLFIEWANIGRDLEMHLPVMYFFEKILKWEVQYKHINNIPDILSIKPNLIFMSSIAGADIYVEIAQYIQNSKIPLLINTTEGFFRENIIEEFVWGWNKKNKIIYESICNYWSFKSYHMMLKYYPQRLNISRMCGSLGHDKYIFLDKKESINTQYKRTIGYAAFDYNRIFENKERYKDIFPEMQKNLEITKSILNYLVKNNQDIMFIIKSHPSDKGKVPLELRELNKFKNIKLLSFDTSIVESISSSNIWLSFSSGSILEAWLQNIPTISFLTDENKFSSDAMFGTVVEDNPIKIDNMIKEFYIENTIKRFEEKQDIRKRLIEDLIGYSDGLNHVRYLSALKPFIEDDGNVQKQLYVPFKYKFKGYLRYLVYKLAKNRYKIPLLRKYSHIYGNWDCRIFKQEKNKYYTSLDKFYSNNNIQILDIYNNYDNNFIKEHIGD